MKKIAAFWISFFVLVTIFGQQKKYSPYTLKKGETIKIVAKRLGLRTKDLLVLNPNISRKPSPETTIIIPNTQFKQNVNITGANIKKMAALLPSREAKNSQDGPKKFTEHQVVKGDTFYSLTRTYNVSENELRTLNPSLELVGLQAGMILKIKPVEEKDDQLSVYKDTIVQGAAVRLSMMLPFRADQYDTIDAKEIFKKNKLVNITTDMYLGALIAVDSLKGLGVDVELSVFDTGRKGTRLDSILSVTDFNQMNAIIGPLYSEEVLKVANKISVPVIFPVYSKKQNHFSSSKIIKTFADREVHIKELMAHILRVYSNENLLIIGDSTVNSIRSCNQIKSTLLEHDSISKVQVIHPSKGYVRKDYLINGLKAELDNWVILATDDGLIASDVVNSLISLPTEDLDTNGRGGENNNERQKSGEPKMQRLPVDTAVKIFAFFKSSQFDRVANNKLAQLGFTYTSDVFIDENSLKTRQFNSQYIKKNHAYPSYYATKGFDIVFDAAMRLASGNSLKDTFKKGTSFRVESKFDYSRNLFSTSTNNGIFILQYNSDLTIKRIK